MTCTNSTTVHYQPKANSFFHTETLKFQQALVAQAIEHNKGNIVKAAKALGLSRGTLYKVLKTTTRGE